MSDLLQELRGLPRRHDHLLCLDSDGCVFDSMGVKQRQVFQPAVIEFFGLEEIAPLVRETMEWTNMFSPHRGEDRFILLAMVLEILGRRSGMDVPDVNPLREWLSGPGPFGNATLREVVESGGDKILAQTLAWSETVDERVAELPDIRPFAEAKRFLDSLSGADAMVVSSTPLVTLEDDWGRHNLRGRVDFIASKDHGKKVAHLRAALARGYAPEKVFMMGDAPKDLASAREVGVRFYPIVPGRENESWLRFREEVFPACLIGEYGNVQEAEDVERFMSVLSAVPPWAEEPS